MSGDAIASEQELSRFRSLFTALTYSMEDTVLQHESGLIEDAEFEAFRERMRRAFMSPAMRVLWKESRVFHGGKFRAFIDAVIRDARAPQTPAGASAEHSLVHWRAAIAAERAAASTLPDTNRPPPTLP